MALPNPGMDFTPFDVLPASDLDKMVANIESLADGTGLNDGVITNNQLAGSITIDKISNPYKFSVYPSANQSGLANASSTIVAFNTEYYDSNNNFTTGTFRYTAPINGYYHFDAHIRVDGGSIIIGVLNITGANIPKSYQAFTASNMNCSLSGDTYLTAGAVVYVTLFLTLSSGTAIIIGDSSSFSGHLISI